MRMLIPSEVEALAGDIPAVPIVEVRALDAVIEAHRHGTRYGFKDGALTIHPPIPPTLRAIGAESPMALKLAVALAVLAEGDGMPVARLADLRTRYEFLRAFGDRAQLIADGGVQ